MYLCLKKENSFDSRSFTTMIYPRILYFIMINLIIIFRFRDLLWLQSHCPLLQKWRDLGTRFWPRWFLEGTCAPRPTCSFPRGMTCKPHKSVDKVLLRWHCQDWTQRLNCDWLKVRYPLVTECRCGC